MAPVFTHGVSAVAIGTAYAVSVASGQSLPTRFWVLSIVCAAIPDIDVIGFAFGVRYGRVRGHRGITHSLLFAAALAVTVVTVAFPNAARFSQLWWALAGYFFVVTASHGVLDAMTNGGLGVAFFAPLENGRYFLPWRPLEVSPIGIAVLFTPRAWEVLKSEFVWVWVPSLAIISALRLLNRP